MQPNAMIQTLKTLKLHGMAQAVGELASQGSPAYQGAEGILDSLLKAEVAEREVRSVSYQVKVAKFPTYRDLSGFDFSQRADSKVKCNTLGFSERGWSVGGCSRAAPGRPREGIVRPSPFWGGC